MKRGNGGQKAGDENEDEAATVEVDRAGGAWQALEAAAWEDDETTDIVWVLGDADVRAGFAEAPGGVGGGVDGRSIDGGTDLRDATRARANLPKRAGKAAPSVEGGGSLRFNKAWRRRSARAAAGVAGSAARAAAAEFRAMRREHEEGPVL